MIRDIGKCDVGVEEALKIILVWNLFPIQYFERIGFPYNFNFVFICVRAICKKESLSGFEFLKLIRTSLFIMKKEFHFTWISVWESLSGSMTQQITYVYNETPRFSTPKLRIIDCRKLWNVKPDLCKIWDALYKIKICEKSHRISEFKNSGQVLLG